MTSIEEWLAQEDHPLRLSQYVEVMAETWVGAAVEDLHASQASEYLRGQLETAHDLWSRQLLVDDLNVWPPYGTRLDFLDAISRLRRHLINHMFPYSQESP